MIWCEVALVSPGSLPALCYTPDIVENWALAAVQSWVEIRQATNKLAFKEYVILFPQGTFHKEMSK